MIESPPSPHRRLSPNTNNDAFLSGPKSRSYSLTSANFSQDSSSDEPEATSLSINLPSMRNKLQVRSDAVDLGFARGLSKISPIDSMTQSPGDKIMAKRKCSHGDSQSNSCSKKVRRGTLASAVALGGRQRKSSHDASRSRTPTVSTTYDDDMDVVDANTEGIYDDASKAFVDVKGSSKKVEEDRTVVNCRSSKELDRLEECLLWWERKCAYCIGKGFKGAGIEHMLRSCPRGGRQQCTKGIGEAIYREGFFVRAGCTRCALPENLCGAWKRSDNQHWEQEKGKKCQWGSLVYDTIIALFHSDIEKFYLDIYEMIQDEGDSDYEGLDHESIATWLTRLERKDENAKSVEIVVVFIQ